MMNLAGRPDCDLHIARELLRCGIDAVEAPEPNGGEVNARITGKLGAFTFRRAWTYWVAVGEMPLNTARRIYASTVGITDVRAAGDCACRPPDQWARYRDAEGHDLQSDPDGEEKRKCDALVLAHPTWGLAERMKNWRFVPNAADVAAYAFVDSYHIDSELGLYLFAQEVRRLATPGGGGAA